MQIGIFTTPSTVNVMIVLQKTLRALPIKAIKFIYKEFTLELRYSKLQRVGEKAKEKANHSI